MSVDVAALASLREELGDDEATREVLHLFLQEAPKLLAEAREGRLAGDARRVERAAHTLKSNAALFGARSLSEACARAERAAAAGDFADAAATMEAAEKEWPAIEAGIRAWLGAQAPR